MSHLAAPVADRDGFRPELEGLRAVAILLVAASHLWWGRVSGGIDVFLVVSGYLITVTLVRRWIRTGRIGAARYLRRLATRLLPAAALVLATVAGFALLVAADGRPRLAGDILEAVGFAALFGENWHLAAQTGGYLAPDRVLNPVEHFWALSMQGQFYVIWLLLVAAVVAITHGTRQSPATRGRWAVAAIGSVGVASLAWAMVETLRNPDVAYVDTTARIWEFAAGGLLALLGGRLVPGRVLGSVLGWLGLAMIVGLGFLGDFDRWFPGFASLWPVAGTALVLVGANARGAGAERLLGSAPLVWLGGLAFGLYLWHWPAISAFAILGDRREFGLVDGLVIVLVGLIASWLMKQLVERPVQFLARSPGGTGAVVPAVAAVLVAALGATTLALGAVATREGDPRAVVRMDAAQADIAADAFEPALLSAAVDRAAAATTPPVPDVAFSDASLVETWIEWGCLDVGPEDAARCTVEPPGGAPADGARAVVLGDSVATSWVPALEGALGPEWSIAIRTWGGCGAADPAAMGGAAPPWDPPCAEARAAALAEVDRERPDLVVVSSGLNRYRTRAGATADAAEAWRAGMAATLDRLSRSAGAVVVLAPPPLGAESCGPADGACSRELAGDWIAMSRAEARAAAATGSGYVSTRDWFCTTAGECPWIVDGTLVRADAVHLTQRFAERLAVVVRSALLEAAPDLPPIARLPAPGEAAPVRN